MEVVVLRERIWRDEATEPRLSNIQEITSWRERARSKQARGGVWRCVEEKRRCGVSLIVFPLLRLIHLL